MKDEDKDKNEANEKDGELEEGLEVLGSTEEYKVQKRKDRRKQ